MSVFQRGGNYLHRRLTKLYSDTKQSYETATVASKTSADEDPVLTALHREFRIQKDRLLAWGLQWSDSNAAPSPDVEIDQKLDQAGLGHVVALVMSDIQKLLIESEMIQDPQHSYQSKMSPVPTQSDSKAATGKNDLVSDDIAKSRSLLSQLVKCIDTLYTLSESRRTVSTGAGSQAEKSVRDPLARDTSGSALSSTLPPQQDPGSLPELAAHDRLIEEFIRQDPLFIHSSCIALALPLDAKSDSEKPPPYEEVVPLEKTRLIGTLDMSKLENKLLFNPGSGMVVQDQSLSSISQRCPTAVMTIMTCTALPWRMREQYLNTNHRPISPTTGLYVSLDIQST